MRAALILILVQTLACSGASKQSDSAPARADRPATKTIPCGPRVCAQGQVCCNESCGICAPPDGVCTMQFCERAGCKSDRDCRAFSDYCPAGSAAGCDCRALGRDEKDPTCAGPGVRCLTDPCRDRLAFCDEGACSLRSR